MPPLIDIPVFAGQGSFAIFSPETHQQTLRDASSRSGAFLLSAFHHAFRTEVAALRSATDRELVDIDVLDFPTPLSLLSAPFDSHIGNAVVSGTTLFAIQSLRYLAHIEKSTSATVGCTTLHTDELKANIEQGAGVIGFSSGILPACVVASSPSTLTYVSNAVESYRLAFWIGVRCMQHRVSALTTMGGPGKRCSQPWSLVVFGLRRKAVADAIESFLTQAVSEPFLCVTSVTNDDCVTVSGRPDVLASFSATLPAGVSVQRTTVDALYHSVHMSVARTRVIEDIAQRGIRFPSIADLKMPIRCTYTGQLIYSATTESTSLVEMVVDMILIRPVNWDRVVAAVVDALPDSAVARLLSIGPGGGVVGVMQRAFPKGRVSSLNLAFEQGNFAREPSYNEEQPIAVVGMAFDMPGGVSSVSKLWEVLEKGLNTISEVPSSRFKISEYNEPNGQAGRTMKAHTGNFIHDHDVFDNNFFCISPREARSMDPQQRILLHIAYEALENAGYVPNATPSFQQATFGSFIGSAGVDYTLNLSDDIDVYYSTGTLRSFLCGRISYAMQLSGPSIVVDTACSSSLVAIYQACRALQSRDCNAALAGGVNMITSPDVMIGLDRGHFLSPTGQCKAFDISADGYARSEGCVMFVLKRLSDAIAEHDNILGVIRGVEVNQNGLASSITRPHEPTQVQLFERLLEKTGVHRSRVNVVEAHSAGTQAGDPSEVEGIRRVFASKRTAENPLHITSMKANIGHLESASGAASLVKVLLMFRRHMIPRQISFHELNPLIAPLDNDHTVIDKDACHWNPSHPGMTRMAVINNFGAAGSNAAILVEEFPKHNVDLISDHEAMAFVIGLSAKTETTLEELRLRYIEYLESPLNEDARLCDIAYTATARRQVYPCRLAVSAVNRTELVEMLRNASVKETKGISFKTVLVFSGQGSHYPGMGSTLYHTCSVFKMHIDNCHAILVTLGFPGILPIIDPGVDGSGLSFSDEFQAYQAAVFSLQYALSQLWCSWGLKIDAVVGHSLGEYAALVTARVLNLTGALTLIASRARLIIQKCPLHTTGMMAINKSPTIVSDILGSCRHFSGLIIACYNSGVDCVVGGPLEELNSLKAYLDNNVHCRNVILSVPYAYHTDAMHPLVHDLTSVAGTVTLFPPSIPIISGILGDVVPAGDNTAFTSDYFARHCTHPVLFANGINAFLEKNPCGDADCWIEIGPHATTLPMLHPVLPKTALLLGSLRKDQDAWATLTTTLSKLYTAGAKLTWREVFSHLSVVCISVPSYPFATTRFWADYKEKPLQQPDAAGRPSQPMLSVSEFMLDCRMQVSSPSNSHIVAFETPIRNLARFIIGHRAVGWALCPASVYNELALSCVKVAAGHSATSHSRCAVLHAVTYTQPLLYEGNVTRTVQTLVTLVDGVSGTFCISSYVEESMQDNVTHCRGEFMLQSTAKSVAQLQHYMPVLSQQIESITSRRDVKIFSTRMVYDIIFPRAVHYAPEYHTVKSLTVDTSAMDGYAIIELPSNHDRGQFVVHPMFMDALLHVAGFIANLQGEEFDVHICSHVDSVEVVPDLLDNDETYGVFCTTSWAPGEGVIVADARAVKLDPPQTIVAHLQGIHFLRVRLSSLRRALSLARSFSNASRTDGNIHSTQHTTTTMGLLNEDDVQSIVVQVVAEGCHMETKQFTMDTDLASLGIDSLLSIEIYVRLQDIFVQTNLNSHSLSVCRTAADLAKTISYELEKQTRISCTTEVSSPSIGNERKPGPNSGNDAATALVDLLVQEIGNGSIPDALKLRSPTRDPETVQAPNNTFAPELSSEPPTNPTSVSTASTSKVNHLPFPFQRCHGTPNLPLVLIHDGSGLIHYCSRFSPLGRDVWGIGNPNFTTGRPWYSLASMATHYITLIKRTVPCPLLIGGWSFGGIVAFEAARQMLRSGDNVKGVLMIDSPYPADHVPSSYSLVNALLSLDARIDSSDVGHLIQTQFRMNSSLLGEYELPVAGGPFPRLAMLRSRDPVSTLGPQTMPSWLQDRTNPQSAVIGWEGLVDTDVKLWDIPGDHFQPFLPCNIGEVSQRVADACHHLESSQ